MILEMMGRSVVPRFRAMPLSISYSILDWIKWTWVRTRPFTSQCHCIYYKTQKCVSDSIVLLYPHIQKYSCGFFQDMLCTTAFVSARLSLIWDKNGKSAFHHYCLHLSKIPCIEYSDNIKSLDRKSILSHLKRQSNFRICRWAFFSFCYINQRLIESQ